LIGIVGRSRRGILHRIGIGIVVRTRIGHRYGIGICVGVVVGSIISVPDSESKVVVARPAEVDETIVITVEPAVPVPAVVMMAKAVMVVSEVAVGAVGMVPTAAVAAMIAGPPQPLARLA
jgi:hypothetical protein